MSGQNETKIQKVMQQWPVGTVATMGYFSSPDMDISRQLLNRYVKSRWVRWVAAPMSSPVIGWAGRAAFMRCRLTVSWLSTLAR